MIRSDPDKVPVVVLCESCVDLRHRFSQLSEVQGRLTTEDGEGWHYSVCGKHAVVEDFRVVFDYDSVAYDAVLPDMNVAADASGANHTTLVNVNVVTYFHLDVRELASLLVEPPEVAHSGSTFASFGCALDLCSNTAPAPC